MAGNEHASIADAELRRRDVEALQKTLVETRFVSDGWHTRTTVPEAAAHVTKDLTQWQKFRVDLRDKMLVGGLPPAAPDGTMHTEVLCDFPTHLGERMTAAYGRQTVFSRKEGPGLIDRCDVCLTPEMVGV